MFLTLVCKVNDQDRIFATDTRSITIPKKPPVHHLLAQEASDKTSYPLLIREFQK